MIAGIPLTPFNVINFAVLVMTVWVAVIRYSRGTSSFVPLLYWAAVIAHMRFFQGGYDYRWVLAGTACGLLLRFEFMNAAMAKLIQIGEFAALGYVAWRTIGLILMW